ncbi:MAG: cobalamin-dependent protein [Nanoarchaeota archaeon]|nr:cobalamin-dependent protein [Nanoarchaeota archaeon]
MKIALVICPSWNIDYPPIGLAYIAAYMKEKGHEVRIFDFNIETYNQANEEFKKHWEMTSENRNYWSSELKFNTTHKKRIAKLIGNWAKEILKEKPKLVGFSIFSQNKWPSLMLAKKIKDMDKKIIIVLGGPHFPNNLPHKGNFSETPNFIVYTDKSSKADIYIDQNMFLNYSLGNSPKTWLIIDKEKLRVTNWTNYETINFKLVSDGSGNLLRFYIIDKNNVEWVYSDHEILKSKDTKLIKISLTDFKREKKEQNLTKNILKDIKKYQIHIVGSKSKKGKIIIQEIGLANDKNYKRIDDSFFQSDVLDTIKKDYIDFIVLGEGELNFYGLVKNLKRKNFQLPKGVLFYNQKKFYYSGQRNLIKNLNEIPFPDFEDFHISEYKYEKLPIIFSRGCIGRCVFCHERNFWACYRSRSAENIYKEIKRNLMQHNIDQFANNDSLINGNLVELEKLCDLIIKNKLNITWGGMARLDSKMDKNLLKKLSKAGCNTISYGLESGSQKILDLMKKDITIKSASRILRYTYSAKIQYITVNIMVGFPKESFIDFTKTLWFIFKNKPFIGRVGTGYPCNIVPGSELFEKAHEYGMISLDKNEPLFWKTQDKYNNYKWRCKKLKILQKFVKIIGLDSLNICK